MFVSPEFSYRAGLGVVPEAGGSSPGATGSSSGSGTAPNRPLPPTPDDDESQGDRTLVLRKVSKRFVVKNERNSYIFMVVEFMFQRHFELRVNLIFKYRNSMCLLKPINKFTK